MKSPKNKALRAQLADESTKLRDELKTDAERSK